jgi:hypothetical protein
LADDSAERIELSLSIADGMAHIDRAAWNSIANPPGEPYDPFLDWDFLEALEATGCAAPDTGWGPRHVLAHDGAGRLAGAAPLYLKSHSRGEFVFDHSWADALHRAGGRYYPKLLCAVPFTPVTGRRLLAAPGPRGEAIRRALARAIVETAADARVSSAHFNFLDEPSWRELGAEGLLLREDQQFHWINRGYRTFESFLEALSSRKRKMLRRERREAQEVLVIQRVSGADLTKKHWDAFFRFYMDTGGRKWGSPYLNREFFALLHERMADRCLLILAMDGKRTIAGALNMIASDTLFGRYWVRVEERPFLHFEICYYQAIDFAIEHGLKRVEAGAQGEHKLARGYLPTATYSAHWLRDPPFARAVADFLRRETEQVERTMAALAAHSPYKREEETA